MATKLIMPKAGLTMTEGVMGTWYKKEGDPVEAGERVFDYETDKLTNDVSAEEAGILLKILAQEGDTVPCFETVGIVGQPGEDISHLLRECGISADVPVSCADPSEVCGNAPAAEGKPAEKKDRTASRITQERLPGRRVDGGIIATPAARKLAKQKNIDLETVAGHGPGGRIVLKDIEEISAAADEAKKETAKAVGSAASGQSGNGPEETIPMTPMRRVIGRRMKESAQAAPTVTYDISVDMTALSAIRTSLKPLMKVTYTDLLVLIVSKALMEFPMVNCSVGDGVFVLKHYVNMGIAVAVENGLLVPVIQNVQTKSLAQISREVRNLAARARSGSLTPDEVSGGTFTISNLGMFGIESFTPIINQPESAILGVNTVKDELYLKEDGTVAARPVMKLSLTADHRAIDGGLAAQFLQRVKQLAEALKVKDL